ncbi:MAG TPA: hypothetical protein VGR73_18255 [Bryobacteraceae bacterium]|nr:hypothetical protein [Bryobacteraceae bacterium]
MAIFLAACSAPRPPTRVFIDPGLAPLIPPDTTVLAGVRVDLLAKHPAFAILASQRAIRRFTEITKIDPAKSLWQVLFVSNGHASLLLGRGKFANELMAPDVSRYGAAGGRFDYKGLSMIGSEQDAMMFINSTTTVIGPAPALRALVDERPLMHDVPQRFAPLLAAIPLESEVWGAYAGGPVDLDFPGNLANLRKVFKMVESGIFYANAAVGLHLTAAGTSPDEQRAQELHDALQGLMALAQIRGEVSREGNRVELHAGVGFPQSGTR